MQVEYVFCIRVENEFGVGPYNSSENWKESMTHDHGDYWNDKHQPLPNFSRVEFYHSWSYRDDEARFAFHSYAAFENWFTEKYLPYLFADGFRVKVYTSAKQDVQTSNDYRQCVFHVEKAKLLGELQGETHQGLQKSFIEIKQKFNQKLDKQAALA